MKPVGDWKRRIKNRAICLFITKAALDSGKGNYRVQYQLLHRLHQKRMIWEEKNEAR